MTKYKSLVTGGAGFIGSHVVDHLVTMGHQVIVLDDLSGGFTENINSQATFINGSILDERLIESTFQEYRFDYVYHLAAYAAEGLSHFIRRFNYQNNIIGSINLINCSVKYQVKRFIFTSSIAVYGTGTLPLKEDQTPKPEDPYGIAKYAIELDLKAAHEMFGLDYVIFRPHNVYGERQNIGDRYRNVIGIFMNQLLQKEPLTIFGDGYQTRAFSHISDVAPYIAQSVNVEAAKNQVFNIGSDLPVSLNELADMLIRLTKSNSSIIHLDERNEVKHAYADHSKFNRVFKIKDGETHTLEEGIRSMWQWATATGAKKSKRFEDLELTKNLPNSWNT